MKKTKITKELLIYLIITICWIALIFSFSLQPAEISDNTSSGFGTWIIETFVPDLLDELEGVSGEQLGLLHHLLRKCAHFTEYFVLGVLMMLTVSQTILRYKVPSGIGACALVASVDETIQRFVPGRSGQVTDVLLDSTGAMLGICVVVLLLKWLRKRRKKNVGFENNRKRFIG